jgi:transposase-like protein
MEGISKSRVSELCEQLDEEVERSRNRPPEGSYPYLCIDATYLKARQGAGGWVASFTVGGIESTL